MTAVFPKRLRRTRRAHRWHESLNAVPSRSEIRLSMRFADVLLMDR